MGLALDNITGAYRWAMANKPKANGYPYLAEALRKAGVLRYVYHLPSCQCVFFTNEGHVASQVECLFKGMRDVPPFDKDAFIRVLRTNQAGDGTFEEFLKGAWESGVVSYEADLSARRVTYYGVEGETYVEDYPAVEITK